LGIPESFDKLFIFVGRLTDQKNPLSFLELVRSAQKTHPAAYFIMIGDGEMAADCDEFIKANRIINIRRISYHPRPPEIMALADGMIITSIYEGLPIAMLEALAVGIPVLATDVGDIRLVLEEYGAGLVSDTKNEQSKSIIRQELWEEFLERNPVLTKAAISSSIKVLDRFATDTISGSYNQLFALSLRTDRK
jgi:glycosyltransferase involved in cell wall biosynthesis